MGTQDSDTEQLQWPDDDSQNTKSKKMPEDLVTDAEDISNIQAYIETSVLDNPKLNEYEGNLQTDLIKRGFDAETAKIIERDLLDTPPHMEAGTTLVSKPIDYTETNIDEVNLEKSIETDNSNTDRLQIVADEVEDDLELSVQDFDEESNNFVTIKHDETKNIFGTSVVKLKDKFSMEICIDDGVSIRLRATNCNLLFDHDGESNTLYDKETQDAVNSISNIDKLYTPLKESIKAKCYEIFDSTLTSLDTPLRAPKSSNVYHEMTVTEIVLEEEKLEIHDVKKRKRRRISSSSSEELPNENKRPKPDPQDLLKTTNIQNFDIETVLTKLHGH